MQKFSCKWGDLAFRLEGRGTENYVFVHNAGGNHQLLKHTISHFSAKGRCLSIDLRGHGQSGTPKSEYTPEAYAEDILSICQDHGLKNITFIGLNFGGNVGIALSTLHPQLISKLILIEPPILMEPWIIQSVEEHIRDLKDTSTTNYASELVDAIIMHASAPDRELAVKAFEKTPRHVQISTYENLLKWDRAYKDAVHRSDIPTLYIQTSKPFCKEEKLHAYFSKLYTGRVVGSGPWASLEVPDQTNSMIERFLMLFS